MKKWWDEITNGGPDNTKFSIVVLRGSQKSWWDEIGVLFYLCHRILLFCHLCARVLAQFWFTKHVIVKTKQNLKSNDELKGPEFQ